MPGIAAVRGLPRKGRVLSRRARSKPIILRSLNDGDERRRPPAHEFVPDTAAARNLGMLTRYWKPFAFLAVLGIAAAAVLALRFTAGYEESGTSRSFALESAKADLHLINALEWQAIATGTLSPEVSERRVGATGRLHEELAPIVARSATHSDLETYLAAVEEEFTLLAQGRIHEAKELDEARVDPSFELVVEAVQETAARYHADSSRAHTLGNVTTTAILAASAILISALLWSVERSNGRAHALIARETARRESDERLRPVQARLQEMAAAIEATPDFVVTLDGAGRVNYVNRAMRSLLGLPESENGRA